MVAPTMAEFRTILLVTALAALGLMVLSAALELARESEAAEVATHRAELAAWQVSQLLQEARDITARAALDRDQ